MAMEVSVNPINAFKAKLIEAEIVDLDENLEVYTKPEVKTEEQNEFSSIDENDNKVQKPRKRLSSDSKLFMCTVCSNKFTRKFSMQRHMMIHTGERPFKCRWCKKSFSQSGDRNRHVMSHLDLRLFACTIIGCSKRFNTRKNLQYHVVTHSTDRRYDCKLCLKVFKSPKQLQYHKNLHKSFKP
jgi:uncharacterized Zn-finger protein